MTTPETSQSTSHFPSESTLEFSQIDNANQQLVNKKHGFRGLRKVAGSPTTPASTSSSNQVNLSSTRKNKMNQAATLTSDILPTPKSKNNVIANIDVINTIIDIVRSHKHKVHATKSGLQNFKSHLITSSIGYNTKQNCNNIKLVCTCTPDPLYQSNFIVGGENLADIMAMNSVINWSWV